MLVMFAWKNSYEIVFSELPDYSLIDSVTLALYVLYGIVFQLTEYKNEKHELVSDRSVVTQLYLQDNLLKDAVVVLMIVLQIIGVDAMLSSFALYVILRLVAGLLAYQRLRELISKL
jgi:hypothetical protein